MQRMTVDSGRRSASVISCRVTFILFVLLPCLPSLASDGKQGKAASEAELCRCQLPKEQSVSCVAYSPNGRKVIIGTTGGAVWVWEPEKEKAPIKLQVGTDDLLTGGVMCLAFSPDSVSI